MKILLLIGLSFNLALSSCALTKSSNKKTTTKLRTQNIKESKHKGMVEQKVEIKNTSNPKGQYIDFKLMNSKNSFRSIVKILKENKKKFTVLTFSSVDCTNCKALRNKVKELSNKLNFDLAHVVSNIKSIDTKTFINKVKEITKSENLKEVLLDTKALTAKQYLVGKTTGLSLFVINKENKKMSNKINTQISNLENLIKQNLK